MEESEAWVAGEEVALSRPVSAALVDCGWNCGQTREAQDSAGLAPARNFQRPYGMTGKGEGAAKSVFQFSLDFS